MLGMGSPDFLPFSSSSSPLRSKKPFVCETLILKWTQAPALPQIFAMACFQKLEGAEKLAGIDRPSMSEQGIKEHQSQFLVREQCLPCFVMSQT